MQAEAGYDVLAVDVKRLGELDRRGAGREVKEEARRMMRMRKARIEVTAGRKPIMLA
jgi:hypothetical protein